MDVLQTEEERQRVQEYVRRAQMLMSQRGPFNDTWDQISEVLRPDATSFTGQFSQQGQKTGQTLFDSTGQHAAELLAAGFYSLLTNPQTKWFEITTTNPRLRDQRDVQIWLNDVTQILLTEIARPQTGFTMAMQEANMDYVTYGNSILYETQKANRITLEFHALPLQECYFVEGPDGMVQALYRLYMRKVFEVVDKFGLQNVSHEVRELFNGGQYNNDVKILHVIEPNRMAFKSHLAKHLPYSSLYFDYSHQSLMSESGYWEKPFQVARFRKRANEVYGRGPGHTALPDLQTLQEVMRTTLKCAQKNADPPLVMPDAAFVEPLKMAPGSVSFYRPGSSSDQIRPIVSGDPKWGFETAQDLRQRIENMFYVNQLQLVQGPQMTATEVVQRTEESMRTMGPIVGRDMTESVAPGVERCFYMLMRSGVLPPPPDIVLSTWPGLSVAFLSPFAKALDQAEANALLRVTQLISPFLDVDPTVMDIFSVDGIARRLAAMYALDPRMLRTPQQVAQVRAQRAQQQQQQQMAEMMKNGGSGFGAFAQGLNQMAQAQERSNPPNTGFTPAVQ
jgi:hypothetical protein